jgi:hypothetical protein
MAIRLQRVKWFCTDTKSAMILYAQQSGMPREIIPELHSYAGQNIIITFKKSCPEELKRA